MMHATTPSEDSFDDQQTDRGGRGPCACFLLENARLDRPIAVAGGLQLFLALADGSRAMVAAHLGLGDRATALALADEAIAVGRQRSARLYEFSALLTRTRALRETRGVRQHSGR